jgi:hypothetical protein
MSLIAFVLRDSNFFRFADGIICSLLEHGHTVILISGERPSRHSSFDIKQNLELINTQLGSYRTAGKLKFVPLTIDQGRRAAWLNVVRLLRSYSYRISGKYQWVESQRERWVTFLPSSIQRVFHWVGRKRVEAILKLSIVRAALARAELLLSPPKAVVLQLRNLDPDVVIATPLLYPMYSGEVDYLKAARVLGRPTCVLVASWDHLTVRGVFPMIPDMALVWNERQVDEAADIHGLPKEKIAAVGAPVFDDWFSLRYWEPREVFCQRAGLDPARPFIVYAVSAPIVGDECDVAVRLVSELTARAGDVSVQVLVRPHPLHTQGLDRMKRAGLHVWPPDGVFPFKADQKRDYFNTLYHAAAVVGLNTSVFLEAMILDKPCVSIASQVAARAPLAHYEHLVKAACCEFVSDEIAAAITVIDLVRGRDTRRDARCRFIKNFIRPHGLNRPAAQVAVRVIETLCRRSGSSTGEQPDQTVSLTLQSEES